MIEHRDFGKTPDGQAVSLFLLTNRHGHMIKLTNYGAILVSVDVPDREGKLANVNLGYSELDRYLERHPYLGSTVGRFCNRIAAGKFSLEGQTYHLAVNNGPNHLHGGAVGFDKLIWNAEDVKTDAGEGIRFQVVSPDGQEGYPGTLSVTAEYTWNDDNELTYTFRAETDATTVLNLTNHAYWNLSGAGSGDVLQQEIRLDCDRYLSVDDSLIPTGELSEVIDTPLDFRDFRALGGRIDQLPATKGYDHCYIINGQPGQLRTCGIARDPASGRTMEVRTTQPGVQLYTGNHLNDGYAPYSGFCLETQHYPDSPNQPDFPTTRLNPGETFSETTVHRFGIH